MRPQSVPRSHLAGGLRGTGPMTQRELTALHESGHVVAGFLLGRLPDRATIEPGEGFLGAMTCVSTSPPVIPETKPVGWPVVGMDARSRFIAETAIIVTLAAGSAVKAYGHEGADLGRGYGDPLGLEHGGVMNDSTRVQEMVIGLVPAVYPEALAYYTALADDLARRPEFGLLLGPMVEALLENGTMTGTEVRRLLRETERQHNRQQRQEGPPCPH